MRGQTTHVPQLEEVDQVSPANDHWGDYKELQSPYEASVAVQRDTEPIRADAHADPEDVRQAFGEYASAPYKATPVRQMPSDSWSADDYVMNLNQQEFTVAEYDPYRKTLTVWNRTTDHVFISPNPNASAGWGSIILPAGTNVTLTTRSKVYLFTLFGYNPGASVPHVSVVRERYA